MNDKRYFIKDIELKFKNLTLRESDELQDVLKISGENLELSNKNMIRFLELVLEPVEKKQVDFSDMDEFAALEVLQDFLLNRIEKMSDIRKSFMTLVERVGK